IDQRRRQSSRFGEGPECHLLREPVWSGTEPGEFLDDPPRPFGQRADPCGIEVDDFGGPGKLCRPDGQRRQARGSRHRLSPTSTPPLRPKSTRKNRSFDRRAPAIASAVAAGNCSPRDGRCLYGVARVTADSGAVTPSLQCGTWIARLRYGPWSGQAGETADPIFAG